MPEFKRPNEQRLAQARERVDNMYTNYEREGKEHVGIDPELQESIAVFLAMGMQTEASCWGHPERRDDPEALWAEKDLVPSIDFTGYEPTDGFDAKGKPVGYTDAQVEAACARMQRDAAELKRLLAACPSPSLELRYSDGVPAARLRTRHADELEDATRAEQDAVIAQARKDWSVFLEFVANEYKQQ